jgi:hypothetical protein
MPGAAHVERLNRAAVLYAPGDQRVQERSMPDPGPHEVLVEVMAVGSVRFRCPLLRTRPDRRARRQGFG